MKDEGVTPIKARRNAWLAEKPEAALKVVQNQRKNGNGTT